MTTHVRRALALIPALAIVLGAAYETLAGDPPPTTAGVREGAEAAVHGPCTARETPPKPIADAAF